MNTQIRYNIQKYLNIQKSIYNFKFVMFNINITINIIIDLYSWLQKK